MILNPREFRYVRRKLTDVGVSVRSERTRGRGRRVDVLDGEKMRGNVFFFFDGAIFIFSHPNSFFILNYIEKKKKKIDFSIEPSWLVER